MPIVRLYEELNNYLPEDKRKQDVYIPLKGTHTVRSIVSFLNIPLSEIDLILVNSEPTDLNYEVQHTDRISVYPVFERLNIKGVTRVRKTPLRRIKFIADTGLKELAERLKKRGFDAVYIGSCSTKEIIERSKREKRIILTANKDIYSQEAVSHALLLKSKSANDQLEEIIDRLDLIVSKT